MIKKEEKIVITFYTTTDAMAMEQVCKQTGIKGRLIPVPPFIFAGCGLAWCVSPSQEEELQQFMNQRQIRFQEIHKCMI